MFIMRTVKELITFQREELKMLGQNYELLNEINMELHSAYIYYEI